MPSTAGNGLSIDYETTGDPASPPLLLISGLGAQLTAWPDDLLQALVDRGLFLIRFDNRDTGRTTWFDDRGEADVLGALAGTAKPAYFLSDMADDAASLLDALGVASAHVLGVSMGGMIAQQLAITHPDRVRSLTSVMSTTGDPDVGAAHPEAVTAILVPPATDRHGAIEQGVVIRRTLASPGFPFREDEARTAIAAAYDRAFHPSGTARQLAAIAGSGDRTEALRRLDCPTLVVHGDADLLIDPSGGRATAAAVPGAELVTVAGMGHEIPPELFGDLSDRVAAHIHVNDGRGSAPC
jgi:pimeloyl-ACP methyl ester carboxylesterase